MKVTVCFGNVRVVVPCGDGDILVKDLTREATLRYRKATGKGPESWVAVHNLQSQGGGILDPDDRLSDVADDREQILASFEDCDGAHHHGGGDGASGSSSIGTGSPDIFHDGEHKYGPSYARDIEVTGEQIASGIPGPLQVRRGSEPALNQLPVGPPTSMNQTKRWSAAPLILEPPSLSYSSPDWMDTKEEDEDRNFRRIARDGSNRLSMQFLGDGAGCRWADAAEKISTTRSQGSTSLPRENKRREPLGQANSTSPNLDGDPNLPGEVIVIRIDRLGNKQEQLGIHVVPHYDALGKEIGLLVQGIEPNGPIDKDGRISLNDRIVEINGQSVINLPFKRIQELFRSSNFELRLRIIKNGLHGMRKPPPPPVYPKFPEDKENVSMVECEQKQSTNTKVATVSPTKKVPVISRNLKSLLNSNTRKIGRKIEIELLKGNDSLGFSITTRDNPAGGNCPIYIKYLKPDGAAVEDGRLKIGDRLLEVNGIEMTGKTQKEAATILRNIPAGTRVKIIVSRQEEYKDFALPRVMDVGAEKEEHGESEPFVNSDVPPNIPPLPQSHLQARTPEKGNAVSRIISQFQEASNRSNSDAMEILRKAMVHTEGAVPGSISLTIARRASSPGPTRNASRRNSSNGLLNNSSSGDLCQSNETDSSITQDHSGASGGSTNTVIFKPPNLESSKQSINDSFGNMNTWNPVLDRLTGHNKQLRNESYYMATHDTWSQSMLANQSMGNFVSPTVNVNSGDTILIEDDCGPRVLPHQNLQTKLSVSQQQHTSNNKEHDSKVSLSSTKNTECSQTTCASTDVTYASQLSLENPTAKTFSRDAFGRQSMSEKRHATLDAKSTDTYQRTKKMREERDKFRGKDDADKLGQLGPSLGMKKSSSLESLQTMVQEIQMQEECDPAYSYRGGVGALKVIRGRGCDESFRAAVDKDYNKHIVDPNHRSETSAKKHWLLDPPSNFDREVDGFNNVRGGPRQSSLNSALDVKNKTNKKKSGIFKGIGSMFRFGKHRKMDYLPEVTQHYQHVSEFDSDIVNQANENGSNLNTSLTHSHKSTESEVSHTSERKVSQQHPMQQHIQPPHQEREAIYQKHGFTQRHAEQVQVIPEGSIPPMRYRNSETHRSERSQLMRAYEQRQAQRQAHYAAMERENETDARLRQGEPNGNYGEFGRAGSRSGITDPVRFTHYVNYNELQNHLSRKQHQYHSQRQVKHDTQLRPVSNFYEYESVQSILNTHARPNNAPHSRLPQRPPAYHDPSSSTNVNPRHPQQIPGRQLISPRGGHPIAYQQQQQQQQQQRGPFVTHVTIGNNHHPQQSGSRV